MTARQAGLVGCGHCGLVAPITQTECSRCWSPLQSRYVNSLQRVWAWWLAGLIAFIPANIYPMMITDTLVARFSSTILGGALELIHHGDVFVGAVVILASVVIPVAKFFAVAYLALMIQFPGNRDPHRLHLLYEVVEFIGRWSMIDVFVVAILSALVHLGGVADIYPGIAAICFAATVIFTMFSALSLDPRLIWDAYGDKPSERKRTERA
ncbi:MULTISPECIES: paraquat-inducible protein A [unclassified Meridianimarinicoccus]|uniref:paraquat-inducible protein A n=1 Tax=unclassified Meridianimarinicoccus TaxID=2923344 RepID=UPI00299F8FA8|nr:paraquat-inducible protein A [Fluviibacterium sp. MJW13]